MQSNNNKVAEKAAKPRKLFYSVKELAELLLVSKSFIYCKVESKEYPCRRIGKRILIPASFVEHHLVA